MSENKIRTTEEKLKLLADSLNRKEAMTMETRLSAIEINENSLDKGTIGINGSEVKVEKQFFMSLGSLLKLNQALVTEMVKNNDGKLAAKLMQGLKAYRSTTSKGSSNEVLLVGNPETQRVTDIMKPERYRKLTNKSIYGVCERILNDSPRLDIETVDLNRLGHLSVNILNDDEVGFANLGKDEFFKFGFSLIQTSKDTLAETYNQRLVCSNGMRSSLGGGSVGGSNNPGLSFSDKVRLGGHSADDIAIFLKSIEAMQKAKFVPAAFESTLDKAMNTKASLIEVQSAMNTAIGHVDKNDDPTLTSMYISKINREYFHGYDAAMRRIVQKGANPLELNDRHKSFIKTHQSVWDVINSLTFLGSNNVGIPFTNEQDMKVKAGGLFAKGTIGGYDLQFAEFARL